MNFGALYAKKHLEALNLKLLHKIVHLMQRMILGKLLSSCQESLTLVAQTTKEQLDKLDFIKIKNCMENLLFKKLLVKIKSNNIFAAVDRFSIKPLYYYQDKKKNLTIITSDFSTLIKNNKSLE